MIKFVLLILNHFYFDIKDKFCHTPQLLSMMQFMPSGSTLTRVKLLSIMQNNLDFYKRNSDDIKNWLDENLLKLNKKIEINKMENLKSKIN